MSLAEILKNSKYKLTQFSQQEIDSLESAIFTKKANKEDKAHIRCLVRNKDIQLKPEEAIRQLYLRVLIERYGYPLSRMTVEYPVNFGTQVKRADIVIFDKDNPTSAYIIVELKRPKLKDGKEQLKSYCNAKGAPIGVWTNGNSISFYHRKNPNYFEDITDIPNINQTLADILNEKFTLDDLIKKDKLVNERKSLKDLILEMEDEVLANAGVDVFEEVFKLVFTKLYDEWLSGRKRDRLLEFRNTGQTETALKNKLQKLFDRAKQKWEGVFSEDSKISLSPSHLSICISSLENVKLFNSNLDVVDEAFEYLINKSSKGEKGQFFTPRYVIDMCVKMLNPKEDEYLIDPAAGSAGFPVHSIFHVWRQILEDEGLQTSELFTLEKKPFRCEEYVREKVFAIDFDEKAVRVARTLNLIAGDGQTNVLHLNTLDFDRWDETIKDEDWQDTYFEGFKKLKKLRQYRDDFKEFKFDILMANPPFAGDIKESRLLAKYQLARKSNGKWETKLGRDILFIERNLDFLNPGGRMAVILPQGRFNNASDKPIRDFIAERCRILAVVGLHGNTFKPHTGTKTSVLFLQKWNDDPNLGELCPRVEDYNIFFATMRKSGKDNSGDKIWRKIVPKSDLDFVDEAREFLQDKHGHLIVDHDLFNHDGLTEDGIAEAFIEFAKKEKLSFFRSSLSVIPFDSNKYQSLMDGLEAVELKLSEIQNNNYSIRIDAEFFQKKYLNDYHKLINNQVALLSDITIKIDVGHVGSMVSEYNESGVLLLQTKNIDEFLIKVDECTRINIDFHKKLKKSQVKYGDVLIARSGSFGKASIYLSSEIINSADIIIVECNKKRINPFYLVAFLNSKLGVNQLYRFASGGVQGHVNLTILENLQVPLLSFQFQNFLENVIKYSSQSLEKSKYLYQQAEDLLLSELNLKYWQPTEENIAVKSFSSSFLTCDRLDAEYYQPKFDRLIQRLEQKVKLTPVGHFLTFNQRGKQPKYTEDKEKGLPVINSKHVRIGKVILTDNRFAIPPNSGKIVTIQKNDVLINGTGVGTIGRCATYLYDRLALPDNHVTILRTNSLDPVYLSVYINSIAGQFQVEKNQKGSSGQIELYPDEIATFLVWDAPASIQKQIRDKVETSHFCRQKSQQLLAIAKTGVEKAIESDENKAIEWIDRQLNKLGIDYQFKI